MQKWGLPLIFLALIPSCLTELMSRLLSNSVQIFPVKPRVDHLLIPATRHFRMNFQRLVERMPAAVFLVTREH